MTQAVGSPEMFSEWDAWQRVVGALKGASASIDINQEAHLCRAIELWGETLVALRMLTDEATRARLLDEAIDKFNATL